jgi:hypothetical protein
MKNYNYIKESKNAVLKKYKIKGGEGNSNRDYNWNELKEYFLDLCKFTGTPDREKMNFEFKKINKPNTNIDLVIFGKEIINNNGNNYLPYIYYLFNTNIKFKKISFINNQLIFENISYEQLKQKINGSNDSYIDLLYWKLIQGTAQYSKQKSEGQTKLVTIFIDQYKPQQLQQTQQQPQQPDKPIDKTFNITKQNITNKYYYYRCIDPSLEVNVQDEGNIFFGYDEYLFTKSQDNSYKLYYKYSYRGQNFSELIKNPDGTFQEKPIDIKLIPTYDILRLYDAIKDNPKKVELKNKLIPRIEIAKQNISKSGEGFFKLEHSNFAKEQRQPNSKLSLNKKIMSSQYKNFGKLKKKRNITGGTIYIFFGATTSKNVNRNSPISFLYVCFEEGKKGFFYMKTDLIKKIPLYEFPYIYPLEDLISFILLRRQIFTDDKTFADIIYKEADARIKFLKVNNFSKKMLKQEFPENYDWHGYNTLKESQNYKNRLIKQKSILPRSPEIISKV